LFSAYFWPNETESAISASFFFSSTSLVSNSTSCYLRLIILSFSGASMASIWDNFWISEAISLLTYSRDFWRRGVSPSSLSSDRYSSRCFLCSTERAWSSSFLTSSLTWALLSSELSSLGCSNSSSWALTSLIFS